MGLIPIYYSAYDNDYKIPMGICLSIGLSALIFGLSSGKSWIFVIGVISLILFFVLKYLNYTYAKKEHEEKLNTQVQQLKKEVDAVLYNDEFDDEQKSEKLIELSQRGNIYATALIIETLKRGE